MAARPHAELGKRAAEAFRQPVSQCFRNLDTSREKDAFPNREMRPCLRRRPVISTRPGCPSKFRLSQMNALRSQIHLTTAAGTRTGNYRLITILISPDTHPAAELVRLHRQRWESN
ncbi:hypothetical protein Ato02nite_074800 [Paractinoplanes toevensis]|uniref:Uncharacterized protein n=1 Tax=Paractinoplanes toevensis TaxID=571911 RepID=A0A919W493_9ACTN|nr:hypothetical protein Ato02nite_074800 [Actinoplanes toevensis]